MRDHGGNLDAARARYPGVVDWIDLSTGINPEPYPLPDVSPSDWACLPTRAARAELEAAAQAAYGTRAEAVALAGAQAAIQLVPLLRAPGQARIVAPTYNEHGAALRAWGWQVTEVADLAALAGADLAIVVNPNNPTGAVWPPDALADLAGAVGLLVVDESFVDPVPEVSLAPGVIRDNLLILRSFGKFYGLAGLRLGFALAQAPLAGRLRDLAGPWPIPGPAHPIGCAALGDRAWQAETIARLAADRARLVRLGERAGWRAVGGTALFQTFDTGDALGWQARLAAQGLWTRAFPYAEGWLRLGLPPRAAWPRLEAALVPV